VRSPFASPTPFLKGARFANAAIIRWRRAVSHAKLNGTSFAALQARREIEVQKVTALRNAACGQRIDPVLACGGDWLRR